MSDELKSAASKATSYRLVFDHKAAKKENLQEAIGAVLARLGCGSCGRVSMIDVHLAEKEHVIEKAIPGLLSATEFTR